MRQHRIYTEQTLLPGQTVILEEAPSRHLVQVLRLKIGAEIVLFNGDGYDYPATLQSAGKRDAEALIHDRMATDNESPLQIQLAIGISKGERMDFAIQKAVELGVTRITPLLTERSVVRLPPDRQDKKLAHWRGIIIAACEQSGRNRIPDCDRILSLSDWLDAERGQGGLLLDHRSGRTLRQIERPKGAINLLVGPEGGLAPGELELALRAGMNGIALGPRVLRTETAPLAVIAALQLQWGDFG